MNFAFFISKRIAFPKSKTFSGFIVKMAILATTLSLSVMIIATSTITGFQKEIGEKVYGFWGHINIKQFDFNYNYAIGDKPINKIKIFTLSLILFLR